MNRFFAGAAAGVMGFVLFATGCGGSDDIASTRRTCALLVSCPNFGLPGSAMNGGQCFAASAGPSDPNATRDPEADFVATCARTSSSCETYRDCVSRNHGADYCTANPGVTCDGDVIVTCPTAQRTALDPRDIVPTQDCALVGAQCHHSQNSAYCSDGTACDPTLPTASHCDGTRIVSCNPVDRIQVVSRDCANFGQTCTTTTQFGQQIPQCTPTGATCTVPADPSMASSCSDSTTLVTCVRDQGSQGNPDGTAPGHQTTVSCSTSLYRGHCGELRGVAQCIENDNECAPTSPDRCNGDTLEICVNGHYEGTSCGSLGFARCTQLTFETAACTNNAQ